MSIEIAIVAVGYNRIRSLKQLLASLSMADYCGDNVDLVVSLDRSEQQDDIVKELSVFEWPFGRKRIRAFPERQGLRKHILACGDLTEEYDAVVVLEDDLVVSTQFYKYLKQVIPYYADSPDIAGISLYSYAINEFCGEPFVPAFREYDTFLMQVAQSWGQCWTKQMWRRFREWEYCDAEELPNDTYMPLCIFNWGKSSWKKNYMAYLVKNNRFFVYPYHSFTTNCSLAGEHSKTITSNYQVPLVEKLGVFNCAPVEAAIKYDVFFERIDFSSNIELAPSGEVVGLDFYGLRRDYSGMDILVSRNQLPYKIIRRIGLVFKPFEMNLELLPEGNVISIYDLKREDKVQKCKNSQYEIYEYNTLLKNTKFLTKYILFRTIRRIKRIIKNIFKNA